MCGSISPPLHGRLSSQGPTKSSIDSSSIYGKVRVCVPYSIEKGLVGDVGLLLWLLIMSSRIKGEQFVRNPPEISMWTEDHLMISIKRKVCDLNRVGRKVRSEASRRVNFARTESSVRIFDPTVQPTTTFSPE